MLRQRLRVSRLLLIKNPSRSREIANTKIRRTTMFQQCFDSGSLSQDSCCSRTHALLGQENTKLNSGWQHDCNSDPVATRRSSERSPRLGHSPTFLQIATTDPTLKATSRCCPCIAANTTIPATRCRSCLPKTLGNLLYKRVRWSGARSRLHSNPSPAILAAKTPQNFPETL